MTRDELIHRLKKYEWSDIEFKEATRATPRSSYETVSAFANTAGGWLVFGVRDHGGSFEIVGVIEVDKVQNEFLSTLRSGQKMSHTIDVSEEIIEANGDTLLVFHVPESSRDDKPVYLDGDIRRSFIRRGGLDARCTPAEIKQFLRDASDDRYDGKILDALDAEEFFDPASVRWYRRAFDERNPGLAGIRHSPISSSWTSWRSSSSMETDSFPPGRPSLSSDVPVMCAGYFPAWSSTSRSSTPLSTPGRPTSDGATASKSRRT